MKYSIMGLTLCISICHFVVSTMVNAKVLQVCLYSYTGIPAGLAKFIVSIVSFEQKVYLPDFSPFSSYAMYLGEGLYWSIWDPYSQGRIQGGAAAPPFWAQVLIFKTPQTPALPVQTSPHTLDLHDPGLITLLWLPRINCQGYGTCVGRDCS